LEATGHTGDPAPSSTVRAMFNQQVTLQLAVPSYFRTSTLNAFLGPLEGSRNLVGEETGVCLLEDRGGEKPGRGFVGSNLGSLSTHLNRHAAS